MQTICMDEKCLKNCLQVVLNGKKNILNFNEAFIEIMIKIAIKDIFLKEMFNTLAIYMNCIIIYHYYLEKWKLINVKNVFVHFIRRKNMLPI